MMLPFYTFYIQYVVSSVFLLFGVHVCMFILIFSSTVKRFSKTDFDAVAAAAVAVAAVVSMNNEWENNGN